MPLNIIKTGPCALSPRCCFSDSSFPSDAVGNFLPALIEISPLSLLAIFFLFTYFRTLEQFTFLLCFDVYSACIRFF